MKPSRLRVTFQSRNLINLHFRAVCLDSQEQSCIMLTRMDETERPRFPFPGAESC